MPPIAQRTLIDDDASDPDANLYKVDTVPPPAGEGDAYSAPTRVGSMARDAIDQIFERTREDASDVERAYATISQASGIRPTPSFGGPRRESNGEIVSLWDRDDDEHLEATALSDRMQAALALEKIPGPPALPTLAERACITLPATPHARPTSVDAVTKMPPRRRWMELAGVSVLAALVTGVILYLLFTKMMIP